MRLDDGIRAGWRSSEVSARFQGRVQRCTYGKRTCVITLEYKKIFMDEWTGTLDIGAAQDLRTGLMHALGVARTELAKLNR